MRETQPFFPLGFNRQVVEQKSPRPTWPSPVGLLFGRLAGRGHRLRAMSLKCQERITRWIASVRRKEKLLAIDAV